MAKVDWTLEVLEDLKNYFAYNNLQATADAVTAVKCVFLGEINTMSDGTEYKPITDLQNRPKKRINIPNTALIDYVEINNVIKLYKLPFK